MPLTSKGELDLAKSKKEKVKHGYKDDKEERYRIRY